MNAISYGPGEFQHQFGVSRETMERLENLHGVLQTWNPKINLVSRNDVGRVWHRHFADSAQLAELAPKGGHWVDIGSGAGFPGLVVAAMLLERPGSIRLTLVESDQRKSVFLAEAARAMGLEVEVLCCRIENLGPLRADVLSARAFGPLAVLLGHLEKHRAARGIGLFPKGQTVHSEIEAAQRTWRFDHRVHQSATDHLGSIVEVGSITSV